MAHFAVSAVGADRPGIVAAVTRVLVDTGCNIDDSSMSILRRNFAMMLVVDGPGDLDAAALEAALGGPAEAFDLVVSVRPIPGDAGAEPVSSEGDEWTVSVYGADRPGIVYEVTKLLADEGVNITGLTTRVIGDKEHPVYAMLIDATLPDGLDPTAVNERLAELGRELKVECAMHPSEADIL